MEYSWTCSRESTEFFGVRLRGSAFFYPSISRSRKQAEDEFPSYMCHTVSLYVWGFTRVVRFSMNVVLRRMGLAELREYVNICVLVCRRACCRERVKKPLCCRFSLLCNKLRSALGVQRRCKLKSIMWRSGTETQHFDTDSSPGISFTMWTAHLCTEAADCNKNWSPSNNWDGFHIRNWAFEYLEMFPERSSVWDWGVEMESRIHN